MPSPQAEPPPNSDFTATNADDRAVCRRAAWGIGCIVGVQALAAFVLMSISTSFTFDCGAVIILCCLPMVSRGDRGASTVVLALLALYGLTAIVMFSALWIAPASIEISGGLSTSPRLSFILAHILVTIALALTLAATWLAWQARRATIRIARRDAGNCPACNYNLHGNTTGRCPECGQSR